MNSDYKHFGSSKEIVSALKAHDAAQKPIKIKASHEGLLHKDTHTPAGQKIPMSKVEKAAHSSNPAVRKRANFDINIAHKGKK